MSVAALLFLDSAVAQGATACQRPPVSAGMCRLPASEASQRSERGRRQRARPGQDRILDDAGSKSRPMRNPRGIVAAG